MQESDQRLLTAIAQQLQVPLVQVARLAEVTSEPAEVRLKHIAATSNLALQLVEGYLLGLSLSERQTALALEPVSVTAVMDDTAHVLAQTAELYGCNLEVRIEGRIGPVMAYKPALEQGLFNLGYGLIEALASRLQPISLGLTVRRSRHGIIAGMYAPDLGLEEAGWQRAKKLFGRARQPFMELSPSAAAGLFIADRLFDSMDSQLKSSRWRGEQGLATILQPSRQLTLLG